LFFKKFINRHLNTCFTSNHQFNFLFFISQHFRGWKSRQEVPKQREQMSQAAIVIQKNVRGFLTRRQYQRQHAVIVCIQKWFRTILAVRVERNEFLEKREAVVKIQKFWRARLMIISQRAEYQELRTAT
jgi:hypothetical protein